MSTTVSYKGQTLTTVSNDTKTLLTEGKYLEDDLTLTDVSGSGATLITKNISENGTYNASSDSADGYSQVTVAVPASAVDTGTKPISTNGTHDVTGYASANVNVPNSYSQSDEGKVVSNGALVAQTAHADVTPTTSDQTIDTTTNDSIKVKGDADLVASNIKKDVEIFGVTGSYEGGGGGGGIPLPTGWTQLDYADTTGSCAVDTGMKFTYPSTGSSLQMKFGILNRSATQIIFSSGTVGSTTSYGDQMVIVGSKLRMDRENGSSGGRFLLNVGDDVEYNSFSKNGDAGSYSFGCNLSTGGSYGGMENQALHDIANPTHNMILFAEYKNSTYQTFATVRFYELCYREGSAEIIHLYPVKDNNNVICLYDTVNETAIYPATGQLVNNAPQLLSAGRILMGVEE